MREGIAEDMVTEKLEPALTLQELEQNAEEGEQCSLLRSSTERVCII
jgi:hypothetical protein